MYKMEIVIFGQKLRVEVIIICVILGYILGGHLLCSCSKVTAKEGLALLKGAPLDYRMGSDVKSSWENKSDLKYNGPNDWFKSLENNIAPNPQKMTESGQLDLLADNKFDPNCCPSFYSSSMGCACLSPEQAKYLSERGGNRTFATEY
jgi:hypothetical protein